MAGDTTLRPYYDHDTFNAGYLVIFRPGVGLIDTATNKPVVASLGHHSTPSFASGGLGLGGLPAADKNYVYDLELMEYLDVNNALELFKNLVWNFVKNYFKVLVSQPLEIVRLVVQVGYFDFTKKETRKPVRLLDAETDGESDEEVDYFLADVSEPKAAKAVPKSNKIQPVSAHTIDIMSAIAAKDGPFALFRGINASFIYITLAHTIEAWITGFLSPFMSIPDPFFLDLTHLPEPVKLLWLSVLACVLAGVVLMPLDLIKVRLMLTQFMKPDATTNLRSVRESIRHYPLQYLLYPPPTITLLTVLHLMATTVFRKAAPYILFIRYNIDSYLSPSLYTAANLVLLIAELFVKLPVENLLRKEQVRFLLKPKSAAEDSHRVVTIDDPEENLIVNFRVWESTGGFWSKLTLLGLFHGWRVGVLNVIGFWGYNIFNSSTVLTEERL